MARLRLLVLAWAVVIGLDAVKGAGAAAQDSGAGAPAETPMSADAFERFSTGKTLTYAQDGVIFGTEFYGPGRRVLWAFAEQDCQEGTWYPKDDLICFAYGKTTAAQCWIFFQDTNGLTAQFVSPDGIGNPVEVAPSASPLGCSGPEVGV